MSELRIFSDSDPSHTDFVTNDVEQIQMHLRQIGVDFERWEAMQELDAHATQDEVIEAYRDSIDALMSRHGFRSVDVIGVNPDHPEREALRSKFLNEHVHDDFEVRFFVDGQGLFFLHADDKVYSVLCTAGDLIRVPAGTRHWFDMGPQPRFKAVRLFTSEAGWQAKFTGDPIAERFPRLNADGVPERKAA